MNNNIIFKVISWSSLAGVLGSLMLAKHEFFVFSAVLAIFSWFLAMTSGAAHGIQYQKKLFLDKLNEEIVKALGKRVDNE